MTQQEQAARDRVVEAAVAWKRQCTFSLHHDGPAFALAEAVNALERARQKWTQEPDEGPGELDGPGDVCISIWVKSTGLRANDEACARVLALLNAGEAALAKEQP